MAGTIESSEIMNFKRLVFRATRGKVLSYIETIDDQILTYQGRSLTKAVYVLVFEEGHYVRDRIERICDSFQSNRFPLP